MAQETIAEAEDQGSALRQTWTKESLPMFMFLSVFIWEEWLEEVRRPAHYILPISGPS